MMADDVKTILESQYFAAQDPEKLSSSLLGKSKYFFDGLSRNGYVEKIRDSWRAYHGAYFGTDGHKIFFGGEQGEITHLAVNHYHNIAQHMLVMVTANRPAMIARATNTDYKSIVQTKLADGLLDYYMREKRLEKYLRKAVEYAIVLGAGYVKMEWDATSGEIWDYIDDTPIYEGDVSFSNLSPFDVMFDGSKEDFNHNWIVCRTWKNKWDLVAKYPDQADKIKGLPTKGEVFRFRFDGVVTEDESEDVPVYEFYHKRTESLPEGRYMMFLSENINLYDGPMPYRDLPIYRIVPGEILGTPYGYTPMFDLLPLQEAVNSLYSAALSNNTAFGVQNLLVPQDSNIVTSQLFGGLNVIEYDSKVGPPTAFNPTATPAETYNLIATLIKEMETVSGVNSVARGNPEASLRSGNSLALVQSMALQFMSGLQQSYVQLIEDVGTGLINMLKDFAQTPRVASIVGQSNRSYLKEFQGADIDLVNRVIVDLGNPLAQTKAGRAEMANNLLQFQKITPEQYFTVLKTGNLDVMTESTEKELILVRGENEAMVRGDSVVVTFVDEHVLHIREHRGVLADPDLRRDPELVSRVLNHIQEHINQLRQGDPATLMVLGQQPIQDPAMMMQQQPNAGAPQEGPIPPELAGMPVDQMAEGLEQMAANLPESPNGLPILAQNLPIS
jgi:hypothetical protein